MSELMKLPPETNQFEANGTLYTFEESLSIERYMMFRQFRLEVGFGLPLAELRNILQKNIDSLQRIVTEGQNVLGEMMAVNYNALQGIVDARAKEPFAVWMCTLFFNAPGEDRRWFNEEVMRKKILDWREAGIESGFFINRACALISGFREIYEDITRISSSDQQTNPPTDDQPTDQK